MKESITLAPPNSLILIMDQAFGNLPDAMDGQLISSTDSCVAVGTLAESDGTTNIILIENYQAEPDEKMVFDGTLITPNKELSISDVDNKQLLTIRLTAATVRVQIYVNDPIEPSKIVINIAQ